MMDTQRQDAVNTVSPDPPLSLRGRLISAGTIALLEAGIVFFGYLVGLSSHSLPPIWLEAGWALIALAFFGVRYWPVLFVSSALSHWAGLLLWSPGAVGSKFLAAHIIAAGMTLSTVITLWLSSDGPRFMTHWKRSTNDLQLLVAPFGGHVVGAILWIVAFAVLPSGAAGMGQMYPIWVSCASGAVVVLPFLLTMVNFPQERALHADVLSALTFYIVLSTLCVLAFGPIFSGEISEVVILVFVPIFLWGATRFPPIIAASGLLGVGAFVLWGFATGQGYFALAPTEPLTVRWGVAIMVVLLTAICVSGFRVKGSASSAKGRSKGSGIEARILKRTASLARATLELRLQNWERLQNEELIADLNEQLASHNRSLLRSNQILRTEIRNRQNVETRLRDSEEKYRLLFSNESNAIALFEGGTGQIIDVNDAWLRLYRYDAEAIMDISMEETGLFVKGLSHPIEGTLPLRLQKRSDSTLFPAEITLSSFMLQGRPIICAVTRDVTERETTARALRESERRQRALLDALPDQMFRVKLTGEVVDYKPGEEQELLATKQSYILGTSIDTLLPNSLGDLFLTAARKAVATGVPQTLEQDVALLDGSVMRMEARIVASGEDEAVVITRDITVRQKAEEQRIEMERKLLERQKMESLGLLAGGVAHDFNNLLNPIIGNASLMMDRVGVNHPFSEPLSQIVNAGKQAAGLTKQMLAYAGKGRVVMESVNINSLVEQMYRLLRTSVGKSVTLHLNLAATLPPIQGDEVQLQQVLMNLILNASEAIGNQEGSIRIATALRTVENAAIASAQVAYGVKAGNRYVEVSVCDDGSGMDADTVARIFEPFFSTKFTGRGLGLSAVLGIARGHNGGLIVHSREGKGTLFRLFLPPDASATLPAEQETLSLPDAAMADDRRQHILVLDDEPTVCTVSQRMLERLGYSVTPHTDARQALEHFSANPIQYAAVLLDLTMPHLSGYQVMEAMRAVRSDLPIILTSGYSDSAIRDKDVGDTLTAFLVKPFTLDDLQQAVAMVLPLAAPSSASAKADRVGLSKMLFDSLGGRPRHARHGGDLLDGGGTDAIE